MNIRTRKIIRARYPRSTPGLVVQGDIWVRPRGPRAKVLVFDSSKTLAQFSRDHLQGGVDKHSLGMVCDLGRHVIRVGKDGSETEHWLCDSQYFCLIGLVEGHLGTEVITHESVHAAFAWCRRVKKNPWDRHAVDLEEELVCYPAGRIARRVIIFLDQNGFYDEQGRQVVKSRKKR